MAALVFGEHLRRAGLADRVRVSSAGTAGSWHVGAPADSRAAAVLADNGYPVTHTAAQVDDRHLDADLLVAMDSGHLRTLRMLVGDRHRVRMLRSFDPTAEGNLDVPDSYLDVPDPYYGGDRGFTDVLAMIEGAMPGLLDWVNHRLAA